MKLQVMILLPLEVRKVAHCNTVMLSQNFVTEIQLCLAQLIIVVSVILSDYNLKLINIE